MTEQRAPYTKTPTTAPDVPYATDAAPNRWGDLIISAGSNWIALVC